MEALLTKIGENLEVEGLTPSIREAMSNQAGKQVAGLLSTLKTNLSRLNIPEIFWILSGSDFELDLNNPLAPKFLCIGNDSTLSETYTPVISLIILVAIKQLNQPEKLPSAVVIDELPTVYVPGLDQLPATARSNKVVSILGVQDFSQLVDKYGKDKSEVILSNLDTQFFGRTTTSNSSNMISQLFGKSDRTFDTVSQGDNFYDGLLGRHTNSKNKNTAQSIQQRERVSVTDIMNLSPGQFYGIISEGRNREVLKGKFKGKKITNNLENPSMPTVDKKTIMENYRNIIFESKSILDVKKQSGGDLLKW